MKKESKFAVFNYNENDNCMIEELMSYLDAKAIDVYKFFEVEPTEKAQIIIVPTKKEYDSLFNMENGRPQDAKVSLSSRGSLTRDGKILYLSIADYKNTTHAFSPGEKEQAIELYKKTLVHEFVHFVNVCFNKKNNCSFTEKFLVEGIACYLSGQKEGKNIDFNFEIDDVLNREKQPYDAYYALTKYFIEHYDKQVVLEIFQSSRQARELLCSELFEKTKSQTC